MNLKTQHLWRWLAGLLPAVGLLGLVAKAEVAVRHGPTFRIPIRGYDPRDMLRGQYLRYQFDFAWQGDDSCGTASQHLEEPMRPRIGARSGWGASEQSLHTDCCLCVRRTLANGFNPTVRQVECTDTWLGCDGWIRSSEVMPPLRYFVPEERARDLERALNDTDNARPSIELRLPRGGKPAVKELYLGDKPWREALEAPLH